MKRHGNEVHDDENFKSADVKCQKQLVCPETGCGKVFRYASQLQKHEASHGKFPFDFLYELANFPRSVYRLAC